MRTANKSERSRKAQKSWNCQEKEKKFKLNFSTTKKSEKLN